MNDNKGARKAHKKLAEANQELGNISLAIKHLDSLLGLSFDDANLFGQAEATLKLGLLYYKEGEIHKAVTSLERNFELLSQMNETELVDEARVNLGIAKANLNLGKWENKTRYFLQSGDEEYGLAIGMEGEAFAREVLIRDLYFLIKSRCHYHVRL